MYYVSYVKNKNSSMKKFCVMTALTSEIVSGGRRVSQCVSRSVLVFNAEDLRNTSVHGCLVLFKCKNFSVDESASTGDWKNAFEYKIESGDMVLITINPGFSKPVVIMPYFG